MSRYIDAVWLMKYFKRGKEYKGEYVLDDLKYDAPSIDIVRCRECKHKYQEPWNNGVAVEGECEIWHNATLDNDFCSYGERKESE